MRMDKNRGLFLSGRSVMNALRARWRSRAVRIFRRSSKYYPRGPSGSSHDDRRDRSCLAGVDPARSLLGWQGGQKVRGQRFGLVEDAEDREVFGANEVFLHAVFE